MSKDIVTVATLFAGIVILRITFASAAGYASQFVRYCIDLTRNDLSEGIYTGLFIDSVIIVAKMVAPVLIAVLAAAVIATFAQTQFLVTAEPMKPKFNRINPISGFKRLFSLKSLVQALKGIIEIAVLLYFIYSDLVNLIATASNYLYSEITGSCEDLFTAIFNLVLKIAVAFLVVAALDYIYQWWDFERQMKMTKQEVKEEYKQTEGDPKIKGKIKELQRKMSQSRMMQQVPKSDVIIRNPTHVAVALRYHADEDEAPVVLAKGLDELALRIVAVAEENDIPVIENVEVARALYKSSDLNRQIPPQMYEAVAEVMVYLYKLGRIKAPNAAPKETA